MTKKNQTKAAPKKVYTTSVMLEALFAVEGENPDDARDAVYRAVDAMQRILKPQFKVLAKPLMEEYDMKKANTPKQVEVEVDGE